MLSQNTKSICFLLNCILVVSILTISCKSEQQTASTDPIISLNSTIDWGKLIGKKVSFTGEAADVKMGAIVTTNESVLWLDDLERWPDGIYTKGKEVVSTQVFVTGILTERNDLPVAETSGNKITQGVSNSGENPGHRYVLTVYNWYEVK